VSLSSGNDAYTAATAAAATCQSKWDAVWLTVNVHAVARDNQLGGTFRKYAIFLCMFKLLSVSCVMNILFSAHNLLFSTHNPHGHVDQCHAATDLQIQSAT